MEQQKEELRINSEIIKMLDDVENVKKLEALARLELIRQNEKSELER